MTANFGGRNWKGKGRYIHSVLGAHRMKGEFDIVQNFGIRAFGYATLDHDVVGEIPCAKSVVAEDFNQCTQCPARCLFAISRIVEHLIGERSLGGIYGFEILFRLALPDTKATVGSKSDMPCAG